MGYIAIAKICQNRTVHLPTAVMKAMRVEIGDELEFYPATTNIDEAKMLLNDMILIKVKKE